MPQTITKTGIRNIPSLRTDREILPDGTVEYFFDVTYIIETDDPKTPTYRQQRRLGPLTGQVLADEIARFQTALAFLKSEEGIP